MWKCVNECFVQLGNKHTVSHTFPVGWFCAVYQTRDKLNCRSSGLPRCRRLVSLVTSLQRLLMSWETMQGLWGSNSASSLQVLISLCLGTKWVMIMITMGPSVFLTDPHSYIYDSQDVFLLLPPHFPWICCTAAKLELNSKSNPKVFRLAINTICNVSYSNISHIDHNTSGCLCCRLIVLLFNVCEMM